MSHKYFILFLLTLCMSHADKHNVLVLNNNINENNHEVSQYNIEYNNIFGVYEKLDAIKKQIKLLVETPLLSELEYLVHKTEELPVISNSLTPKEVSRPDSNTYELAEEYQPPHYSIENNFGCKKREVRGYNFEPLQRMDHEILDNVIEMKNSEGVAYFEMHIAIKAPMHGHVVLSPVQEPDEIGATYFVVDVGGFNNTKTYIQVVDTYFWTTPGIKDTPNILSSTHFTEFYVKIKEATLELGLEGSSSPLVSYSDERLNLVKYFGFACWENREATFLYDCPPRK